MDTKEQLKETSEQLKESIKDTFSNLKDYGKAVASHTGEAIKQGVNALKERFLSFKEGIKHKASSAKAKLGTIKTSSLEKLNPHNLDVKFRDLVEKVEIKGLEVANKGNKKILQFKENVTQKTNPIKSKLEKIKNNLLEKLRNAKNKVTDFFAEKAAEHYLRQEERQVEKEFKLAQKEAEKEEIEKAKARLRERKKDVAYALNQEEREMYEQRHLDNQAKKEELMKQLFGEKEEEQVVRAARAM